MPAQILGNPGYVVGLNQAILGSAPSNTVFKAQLDQANASNARTFAINYVNTLADTNAVLAAKVLTNLGITNATLQTALEQAFAAFQTARGAVVYRLVELLQNLEGDVTFGAAAATYNNAVTSNYAYAADPNSLVARPTALNTVALTSNTDIVSGNIINAAQVFTPGGDDRVNSLQDEDQITGTGTNPTLNFTFGNPNDNGAANITPQLAGVQTVNVNFTANAGAVRLDLQDATGLTNAVNIGRISDTSANVQVDNLLASVPNLSLSNSNSGTATVGINFAPGALAGAADTTTLTLSRVNVVGLSVEDTDGVIGANVGAVGLTDGFETINLVSTGAANTVGTFSAEDLKTLNISGTQNLTIGTTANTVGAQGVEATRYAGGLANVAGSLTAINAAALTGALDIVINGEIVAGLDGTSGNPVNLTITGGAGNDTIRLAAGSNVQNGDRIVGGAGTNTLQLLGNNVVSTDGTAANGPTVTQVQNLDIRTGHDNGVALDTVNVDARAIADLASVVIRNEGRNNANNSASEPMVVNLTNVNAATANGLVLLHGTSGNSTMANNLVNVNSTLAGVTTGGITLRDAPNGNLNFAAAVTFDSDGTVGNATNTITNINLRDEDTEANTVFLTEFVRHTGTVTLTGGRAGDVFSLDTAGVGNGGQYNYDVVGGAVALATQPNRVWVDQSLVGGTQKIQATTINAGAYTGNVVVRVTDPAVAQSATGAQAITMGSGNDVVIFDTVNNGTAGLSISDTVAGGTGADILAIDGNNAAGVTISASELQNVTGFETIQFIGNPARADNNGSGLVNSYNLTLSNNAIAANAANKVLNILNDNGDTTAAAASTTAANSGLTIDARTLSDGNAINYNGQETDAGQALTVNATTAAVTLGAVPAGQTVTTTNGNPGTFMTADRFVLADANINATMIIDGGANRTGGAVRAVDGAGRFGHNGNLDILEARNASVVTIGDLTNISNVSNLLFTNDTSITQTSTLQLDNATVDRLVNSSLAVVNTNATTITNSFEVLNVTGQDSNTPNAFTQLNLDASQVTQGALRLNIVAGGGADTIIGGAGNDTIIGGGGADVITLGAGNDVVRLSKGDGSAAINGVVGTFTGFDTYGDFTTGTDTINLNSASIVLNGVAAPAATVTNIASGAFNANGAIGVARINPGSATAAALDNLANVIAAIGAIANETVGESAYFVVRNTANTQSGVYAWTAVTADNVISANELVLIGVTTGTIALGDLATF